jgi:F-box/leucine-rich repeat protein 14
MPIRVLEFHSCDAITDAAVLYFNQLSNSLEKLTMRNCSQITDRSMMYFVNMKSLQFLDLYGCPIGDQGLYYLSISHLQLKTLIIGGDEHFSDHVLISNHGLNQLITLPLTRVELHSLKDVTNRGFNQLQNMPNLARITITNNDSINDHFIFNLYHCGVLQDTLQALVHVNLSNCKNITGETLFFLSHFPSIKHLIFNNCHRVNDKDLSIFYRLQLTTLELERCDITDRGLSFLKRQKQLANIRLTSCKHITDKGIAHLQKKKLNSLYLDGCTKVTDASLIKLNLQALTVLSVRYCNKLTRTKLHMTRTNPDCTLLF